MSTSPRRGGTPNLAQLISAVRQANGYTYRQLEARCGRVITAARWQQLGTGVRISEFPEPKTIEAIAKALDLDVNQIVLAIASSVGLAIRGAPSELAAMLPEGVYDLTRQQREAVLAVIRAMNPPRSQVDGPLAPEGTTHLVGVSGTRQLPRPRTRSDRAAYEGDAAQQPAQRARDAQDEFHADPEGPESGA